MLLNWFKNDLKEYFNETSRVVLVDIEQEYKFLVEEVSGNLDIKLFHVSDYLSDLEVKYRVEKEYQQYKVLIHSTVDPANNDRRQYMIQEYAATGKVFDRHLARYIREKSGLLDTGQKLDNREVILAGKMSMWEENSNPEFWDNLKVKGRQALFGDFERTVLKFLARPQKYVFSLPENGREILYRLLGEYMEREPEPETDPAVVASDFADTVFNNILYNNPDTENIYRAWLDLHKYRQHLEKYLADYELPSDIDIFQVNPNHPFSELDKRWLEEVSELILSNKECPYHILQAIKERCRKKEGMEIVGSIFWEPVYRLLTFSAPPVSEIEDINEFITIYRRKLYRLDQALRHINQHLLENSRARRAFKALYEEKMNPYLDFWFELFGSYRENQTDYLYQEIFAGGEEKAVIIGDAVSYEVAREIRERIESNDKYNINSKVVNGNFPSTTVNNMSSLFGSIYSHNRQKRESYLNKKLDKELQVEELDLLDPETIDPEKPAVLYSRDIDELSEKGDQSALKYYSTFIDAIVEKVKMLLGVGFREVHLVTDHGFVCNFSIDEADKFSPPVEEGEIHDRYILSNEYEDGQDDFIVVEKKVEGYDYVYFPKGINPVKSKRKYGFAHGGVSPQEVLLPHLIFKQQSSSNLGVKIANKEQLKTISGQNFTIRLQAEEDADLFKQERKISLRVEDRRQTKFKQDFTLKPGADEKIELALNLNKFTIMIQDYDSREVLDSVKGKKEDLRSGLDGLNTD